MTAKTGRPRGRPRKSVSQATSQTRSDGWSNVLANLGNSGDTATATHYNPDKRLDHRTLESLFTGDGMARRVVTVPVDDAMREGIEGDEELLTELNRIQWKRQITETLYWSRLYGGAVLVAVVNDGQEFDAPLNRNRIEQVVALRSYDRWRVTWTTADLDSDVMSANYGLPAYYTITPINGQPYRVHYSRLWKFDGETVPENVRQQNSGWADSSLQAVYDSLRNLGLASNASANIVRDFVQVVLGINGLAELLRSGNEDLVAKRAQIIDLTRSVANAVFIDADGETYDKKASSVAGLADLWDRFALAVSATTGIPATKLMGRAPAGLNSTGESDIRQWYDVVQAYRENDIAPCVDWIIELLNLQRAWPRSDRPESMEWSWPSLWQPTEKEWADIKKTNAETDAIYIDRSGMNAEYVVNQRFGQKDYQPDITLDLEAELQWMAERVLAEGGDQEPLLDGE